jgi:hypothetical protein
MSKKEILAGKNRSALPQTASRLKCKASENAFAMPTLRVWKWIESDRKLEPSAWRWIETIEMRSKKLRREEFAANQKQDLKKFKLFIDLFNSKNN